MEDPGIAMYIKQHALENFTTPYTGFPRETSPAWWSLSFISGNLEISQRIFKIKVQIKIHSRNQALELRFEQPGLSFTFHQEGMIFFKIIYKMLWKKTGFSVCDVNDIRKIDGFTKKKSCKSYITAHTIPHFWHNKTDRQISPDAQPDTEHRKKTIVEYFRMSATHDKKKKNVWHKNK